MFIAMLFRWWYLEGLLLAFQRILDWPKNVLRQFSVPILLKTLFAPWRRILTPRGKGLDAILRSMLDNLISRIIGFLIRSLVLWTAFFMAIGSFLFATVLAISWPIFPAIILFSLLKGVGVIG